MLRSEAEILEVVYRRSHQIRVRRRVTQAGAALVVVALMAALPTLVRDSSAEKVQTVDRPDRLDSPSTTVPSPPPGVGGGSQKPGAGSSPGAAGPLGPSSPGPTPSPSGSGAPTGDPAGAASQDRIAYTLHFHLYVANLDGTNDRHLVSNVASAPSWSPDGAAITYVHCVVGGPPFGDCSGDWGVTVVHADGSHKTRLTDGGSDPTWSPDGNWIAFVSNGISVIRPDGTGERQLLSTTDSLGDLDWSPDGTRIAFSMGGGGATCVPVCDGHVYVMDADGSNLRQITFETGEQLDPAWSPDGQRIAFAASPVGEVSPPDGVIYTVRPDGTGLTKITENPRGASGRRQGRDTAPDWTPDGKIVWVQDPGDPGNADGSGTAEIFLMNSDGSEPVLLFEGERPAVAPRRR